MLEALANLHFLRPAWLWVIPFALALPLLTWWREKARAPMVAAIAPHLREHLVVSARRGWLPRPVHFVSLLLVLSGLAVAGPAFRQELPPFQEDTAPLVIAVDCSRSMDAIDVAPTRLTRVKQKVSDLLRTRGGGRTALIAYAGTAHMVMPLTEDPDVIGLYLGSLATDLMPEEGKNPAAALKIAEDLLADETVAGSILFVTDGVPSEAIPAFVAHSGSSSDLVLALGVGTVEGGPIRTGDNEFLQDASGRRVTATLDVESLQALAQNAGAWVSTVTADDTDVKRIAKRIQSNMEGAQEADADARWTDDGYWLLFPIVLLALVFFRRGWAVRWSSAWCLTFVLLVPVNASADDFRFADLFFSRDQQGQRAFERGDYESAASLFEDPMWKGVACYRAQNFDCAIAQFARVESAESELNLGNAYLKAGALTLAVASYERALEMKPTWKEAEENLALARSLIPPPEPKPEEEDGEGEKGTELGADDIVFDNESNKGTDTQIDASELPELSADVWLRGVNATPSEFLRRKFAIQAAEAKEGGQR
jgi:Ca-activated chloride channel family protein